MVGVRYLIAHGGEILSALYKGMPVDPVRERAAKLSIGKASVAHGFDSGMPADGKRAEPERKPEFVTG